MRFHSKVDVWLLAVFLASACVSLVVAYGLAAQGRGAGLVAAGLVFAVGAGLPLWLLASTTYVVGKAALVIRSGPFSWHVPRAQITRVVETRSPASSPALSLDRLRIEYGAGRVVLVSPHDRDGFLRALQPEAGGA
jgi:hypothetical protein